MADFPTDLSTMRVLISNDDGIESPGIELLERLIRRVTQDVWVCAPASEQSATSHSLTLGRPIQLVQHGLQRFSVAGTPTDCVLLAVDHLMTDRKPDLMVSGINRGRNVGDDVTYSGTVAAALEATILGIPAIAFSQEVRDWKNGPLWDVAEYHLPGILDTLLRTAFTPRVMINVNFPGVTLDEVGPAKVVRQGHHESEDKQYVRADGDDPSLFWIGLAPKKRQGAPDTDVGVIVDGGISITPIGLDLTAHASLAALQGAFA